MAKDRRDRPKAKTIEPIIDSPLRRPQKVFAWRPNLKNHP